MVLRVFLLLGYCFLFSVQLCFRYSPESLDLDAFSSTTIATAHHVHGPLVVHGSHGHVHHILNKRFEPVPELAMPAQEIGVVPVYAEIDQSYIPVREERVNRDILAVPLRGPPSIA